MLAAVVIVMAVAVGTATLFIGFAVLSLRRANRVSPRRRGWAPTRWMWSPSRQARLHRRLRDAVASVRLAVPPPRRRRSPTPLQDMADELEELAADTDRSLALSRSVHGRDRAVGLSVIAARVESIERSGRRLVTVAAELDPQLMSATEWDRHHRDVDERIRAHEDAVEDLRRFDLDWDGTVPTTMRSN